MAHSGWTQLDKHKTISRGQTSPTPKQPARRVPLWRGQNFPRLPFLYRGPTKFLASPDSEVKDPDIGKIVAAPPTGPRPLKHPQPFLPAKHPYLPAPLPLDPSTCYFRRS